MPNGSADIANADKLGSLFDATRRSKRKDAGRARNGGELR
jgi:hypothetical protein